MAWDVSVDVEALLAEHHWLMYGKGAAAMAKVFDRLEEVWLKKVVRENATTSTGGEPAYERPGPYDLLMKVYSATLLAELEHERWCRYHYLNNWRCGVPENGANKDPVRRLHVDLRPFSALKDAEKKKDYDNLRLLLSRSGQT